MRLVAFVGIVTGLALGAAGQASAAVLYDQLPSGTFATGAFVSHDFSDDALDSQGADDFKIGDGQTWTIQGVQVAGQAGRATGSHTASAVLYANAGGLPGSVIFSQSGIAVPDCAPRDRCNFTVPVAGAPRLSPGTYWLSVQTAGAQEWYWHLYTADTTFRNPAVWRNPGQGLTPPHNCTSFRPVIECGASATDGKDFVYGLTGGLIDSRFGPPEFIAKGLKLFADLTLPAAGALVVSGGGVKRATHHVPAGAHRRRVRLNPAIIERLRSGRKAKLRVRFTFTATGGDAYNVRAPVKLVPAGQPARAAMRAFAVR